MKKNQIGSLVIIVFMSTFQKYLVLMLHYKSLKAAKTWHDSVMRIILSSYQYDESYITNHRLKMFNTLSL